jgi:hypothetical protein
MSGLTAVAFPMARRAQRDQVRRGVVQLVPVDVMNVQRITPTLSLLAAILARPSIAIANLASKALPIRRVFPLGDAPTPSGVGCSSLDAGVRFGAIAYCDAVPFQMSKHRRLGNVKSLRHGSRRPPLDHVLLVKPLARLPRLRGLVMAPHVSRPSVVVGEPVRCHIASTRAGSWVSFWETGYWFARASSSRLRCCATWHITSNQHYEDERVSDPELLSDHLATEPHTVSIGRRVKTLNLSLISIAEFPVVVAFRDRAILCE